MSVPWFGAVAGAALWVVVIVAIYVVVWGVGV
jgi:hypothetical protein